MTPVAMSPPRRGSDEDEDGSELGGTPPVEVAPGPHCVTVAVEPAAVMVKTGGFPVAKGPAVAGPEAGVVAVARPSLPPPMTLATMPGTL